MEYLDSINDKLTTINEQNIIYYNIYDYPELIYGNINLASHNLNFSKLPKSLLNNIENNEYLKDIENLSHSSYGTRLRFHTDAKKIIFKIELKQKYHYNTISNENADGFDVYKLDYDKYIHKEIFYNKKDNTCFAISIEFEEADNDICVFLPNFDTINQLFIGLKKGFSINQLPYLGHNKLPIIFCGNEYTIGITASKSGNSYPNMVSKILDQNILNLSYYHMNKAEEYVAKMIGKLNCECIVLDYNGIDIDKKEYKKSFENFYDKLRIFHPNKQIIMLTSLLNEDEEYNKILYELYNDKKVTDKNMKLIDKKEILKKNYIKLDYTNPKNNDEILNIIAQEICTSMRKY